MADFGKAVSCTDSLYTGRYATGLRVVAEAVYRRLITRRGELLDDDTYGWRIADYLGSTTSAAEIAKLPGLLRQEVLKDPRVTAADVDVTETTSGAERAWTVEISCYTDTGPFALTLSVDDVTTALVGFTA